MVIVVSNDFERIHTLPFKPMVFSNRYFFPKLTLILESGANNLRQIFNGTLNK